jgi:prepilin-type N-terminal cleavage/methylation domain-containing protein
MFGQTRKKNRACPNRYAKRCGRGFSLLELLIYVVILSIIVVVISNTFVSLSRGHGQSQAKSEVNNAIRFATELLRQDIKNASVVTTPGLGTPSPSLTLTRAGVTIVYDVSGGILRRKEGAAAPAGVTNSNITVSTPTFTRIENTNTTFGVTNVIIKINMSFSYNSPSPDWSYSDSLQTSVGMF